MAVISGSSTVTKHFWPSVPHRGLYSKNKAVTLSEPTKELSVIIFWVNAFPCPVQLLWGPNARLNNYQEPYPAVSFTARILLWLAITDLHTFLQHVFLEIQENSCLCSWHKSVLLSFDFKVRMSAYLCLNLCVSMSKSWSPQAEAAVKQLIPAAAWKPHLGIVKDSVPFQVGGICLKFTGSTPVRASHPCLINQMRIQFLTLLFFVSWHLDRMF